VKRYVEKCVGGRRARALVPGPVFPGG